MAYSINAPDYWEQRYATGGNSGLGSYGEQLEKKLNWLKDLHIKSVAEVGCGDFNFGSNLMALYPGVPYIGTDISQSVIERNKRLFPQYQFARSEGIPYGDLLLCIDVLFHILDAQEYERVLAGLESRWTNFLAITAYEERKNTSPHLEVRPFNYHRFGEPLIREVVEEEGQLYFYLFKKPQIDLRQVSCCLNTKEKIYPPEVLANVVKYPFGEILIKTSSDSPYGKYETFKQAKYDYIYYQDDDTLAPIHELSLLSEPGIINLATKADSAKFYEGRRFAAGFGWGAIFPKEILKSLEKYTKVYGEDELFKREAERILLYFNYPQNRFSLHFEELASAFAPDRLWRQPIHQTNIQLVEERCKLLI